MNTLVKSDDRSGDVIVYSNCDRTASKGTRGLAILVVGSLILPLLTVLPSPKIVHVHALPFLSPAEITISPTSGTIGTEITVIGQFFTPLSTISLTFDGGSVTTSPEIVSVEDDGTFSTSFVVPDTTATDGEKTVQAIDNSEFANSASASFELTASGGPSNDEESSDDAAARSQSLTIDEDTTRVIALKATQQGDNVQFSIRDNPLHGSLSEFNDEAGTVTYSPHTDYFGTDRFTFHVEGSDVLGTVSITIREINDRPTARNQQVETLEESAIQFTLSGSDVDVGDSVTFSIVGVPTHGRLSGTAPNVTYTPDKDLDGFDSFRFRTSDG